MPRDGEGFRGYYVCVGGSVPCKSHATIALENIIAGKEGPASFLLLRRLGATLSKTCQFLALLGTGLFEESIMSCLLLEYWKLTHSPLKV